MYSARWVAPPPRPPVASQAYGIYVTRTTFSYSTNKNRAGPSNAPREKLDPSKAKGILRLILSLLTFEPQIKEGALNCSPNTGPQIEHGWDGITYIEDTIEEGVRGKTLKDDISNLSSEDRASLENFITEEVQHLQKTSAASDVRFPNTTSTAPATADDAATA